MLSDSGGALVAMPSLRRKVSFIVLYAIGAFILLFTIVAMTFPGCAAEPPIAPEQCYIIDSVTGGLFLLLLASIVFAGLRGGLPRARKIEFDADRPFR